MTAKQTYQQLSGQVQVPLFGRATWLDAVTQGKEWDVVVSADGASALPIQVVSHVGCRWVTMPRFTQRLEAVSLAGSADGVVQALDAYCRRRRIGYCYMQGEWDEALRAALRSVGYSLTERVTYRIAPGMSRAELVARMSDNKRRQLRKAAGLKCVEVDVDTFYDFHRDCLRRQGKRIVYARSHAHSLLLGALARGEARIVAAQDADDRLLAAIALVWDETTVYYLLPCYDPDYGRSGAMAWLTTEVLVRASQEGKVLDFEGSMVPSIARSYREFGGEPVVYYAAEKWYNALWKWVWTKCLRK